MFFLYLILIVFILIIIMAIFTKIKIYIKNVKFSTDKINGRYLNNDYKIVLALYIFGKIKYFNVDITKFNFENPKIKKNINKVQNKVFKNENSVDINILDALSKINIKLKELKLSVNVGTEDAAITAEIVGVISGIIPIIMGYLANGTIQNEWNVMPVYQNRNFLNVFINCIFELKMIHIISTIYILSKKGENYGRTSNRRTYAYSNE